jgi:hypothetical protein
MGTGEERVAFVALAGVAGASLVVSVASLFVLVPARPVVIGVLASAFVIGTLGLIRRRGLEGLNFARILARSQMRQRVGIVAVVAALLLALLAGGGDNGEYAGARGGRLVALEHERVLRPITQRDADVLRAKELRSVLFAIGSLAAVVATAWATATPRVER